MKLVIITAVAEFDNDVKQMLKEAEVKKFSYQEVKGHKDSTNTEIEGNWFARDTMEVNSTMFHVFMESEKVEKLLALMGRFNEQQETVSSIHFAVLNIEQYN